MVAAQDELENPLPDDLPEHVRATMEVRDHFLARLAGQAGLGAEFLVDELSKWNPNQTLRVAFLGGDRVLHRGIAEATQPITQACSIRLDFGLNPTTGEYRRWTTSDSDYSAEIRVSFDQGGYFSLLGTDSISANIGAAAGAVGGRPNQRSLNLGGFNVQLPQSWKRTAIHEFLHAIAFHHEHQSPAGGCDGEFRWEDDAAYTPTTDPRGMFINDSEGDAPGVYTYLAGFPNFWSKAKVDHNLRSRSGGSLTAGDFDRESIMLYRFPSLFYRSNPSPCAPMGNSQGLSRGDIAGLGFLYPGAAGEVERLATRQETVLDVVAKAEGQGPAGMRESALKRLNALKARPRGLEPAARISEPGGIRPALRDEPFGDVVESSGRIRMGAWNIEHLGQPDARSGIAQGIEQKPEDLADYIKGSGVEILSLEEIYDTDHGPERRNRILDETMPLVGAGWRYRMLPNKEAESEQQLCAVAWNSSRLTLQGEPLRVGVIDTSGEFDLFKRHPHALKFSTGQGKTDFIVVPLHLKSNFNGVNFGRRQRRLEAKLLAAQMPQIQQHYAQDRDVVLLGDFNTISGSEATLVEFREIGFVDLNADDLGTFVSGSPFDRILVPAGQPEFPQPEFEVMAGEPDVHKQRLSDHYMVRATLTVGPDDD